ncbi:PadR family transcriptional regulator [Streptomyces minutiscleroticus]|uniref:PadR family transcriptional regulator n=1 Tax=Streptomyces minutiscleroticus TaxID=68238 RepID=UPI00167D2881|nr:helix-turn-helix transcriptional regulator [Streptomyces minutiscleroticus]
MSNRTVQGPALLILTALADTPRHGYGILQEVTALSEGRVRMRTGTLYGALDRLQGQGLIQVEREEVVDGRARRFYRLTPSGRSALAEEIGHLHTVVTEAHRRLGAGPAGGLGASTA